MEFVEQYRIRFVNLLCDMEKEVGAEYVKDLLYRFSIYQFRDPLGQSPAVEELILRVLDDLQKELGVFFEEFANAALRENFDETAINGLIKQWIKEFTKRKADG